MADLRDQLRGAVRSMLVSKNKETMTRANQRDWVPLRRRAALAAADPSRVANKSALAVAVESGARTQAALADKWMLDEAQRARMENKRLAKSIARDAKKAEITRRIEEMRSQLAALKAEAAARGEAYMNSPAYKSAVRLKEQMLRNAEAEWYHPGTDPTTASWVDLQSTKDGILPEDPAVAVLQFVQTHLTRRRDEWWRDMKLYDPSVRDVPVMPPVPPSGTGMVVGGMAGQHLRKDNPDLRAKWDSYFRINEAEFLPGLRQHMQSYVRGPGAQDMLPAALSGSEFIMGWISQHVLAPIHRDHWGKINKDIPRSATPENLGIPEGTLNDLMADFWEAEKSQAVKQAEAAAAAEAQAQADEQAARARAAADFGAATVMNVSQRGVPPVSTKTVTQEEIQEGVPANIIARQQAEQKRLAAEAARNQMDTAPDQTAPMSGLEPGLAPSEAAPDVEMAPPTKSLGAQVAAKLFAADSELAEVHITMASSATEVVSSMYDSLGNETVSKPRPLGKRKPNKPGVIESRRSVGEPFHAVTSTALKKAGVTEEERTALAAIPTATTPTDPAALRELQEAPSNTGKRGREEPPAASPAEDPFARQAARRAVEKPDAVVPENISGPTVPMDVDQPPLENPAAVTPVTPASPAPSPGVAAPAAVPGTRPAMPAQPAPESAPAPSAPAPDIALPPAPTAPAPGPPVYTPPELPAADQAMRDAGPPQTHTMPAPVELPRLATPDTVPSRENLTEAPGTAVGQQAAQQAAEDIAARNARAAQASRDAAEEERMTDSEALRGPAPAETAPVPGSKRGWEPPPPVEVPRLGKHEKEKAPRDTRKNRLRDKEPSADPHRKKKAMASPPPSRSAPAPAPAPAPASTPPAPAGEGYGGARLTVDEMADQLRDIRRRQAPPPQPGELTQNGHFETYKRARYATPYQEAATKEIAYTAGIRLNPEDVEHVWYSHSSAEQNIGQQRSEKEHAYELLKHALVSAAYNPSSYQTASPYTPPDITMNAPSFRTRLAAGPPQSARDRIIAHAAQLNAGAQIKAPAMREWERTTRALAQQTAYLQSELKTPELAAETAPVVDALAASMEAQMTKFIAEYAPAKLAPAPSAITAEERRAFNQRTSGIQMATTPELAAADHEVIGAGGVAGNVRTWRPELVAKKRVADNMRVKLMLKHLTEKALSRGLW